MCQYINAYSTGNKKEALEVHVQLLSYSIIGITETSWDCLHNWNVAGDEYRPFMQDRQGRWGGCVLYVRVYWECTELCLGKDDEPNNSLWVRILGQTNVGNIVLVVCCRLPDQAEAFFRQMEEAPYSQALVLLRELLPPHSCWKENTAGHKYSRKFLECLGCILIERSRAKKGLKHCPSREQALAPSGIHLEEFNGMWACREKGSLVIQFIFKNHLLKAAESLYRWMRNSWQNYKGKIYNVEAGICDPWQYKYSAQTHNDPGVLVTKDIEKAEVFNTFFTSVFTGKTDF